MVSQEIIPTPGTCVDWQTNAVLRIVPTNGVFLLEALEPGAALLYETDRSTGETDNVTGVAIVLPEKDPAGGIYVRRTLADFTWTDPAAWEMVAEGPQGYPDAAGAWVYIAVPGMKKDCHDVLPPELLLSWTPEQLDYLHDVPYWRDLVGQCRGAEVLSVSEMESNEEVWADWLKQDNEYAVGDRKAMEAGGGRYLNFIKIVLRKR